MISVCIATYNGEKYIKDQILSILPQLEIEDEVIISDDGSIDDTIQIIQSIKDDRIKILPIKPIGSPIYNFEKAILEAKGDYIFLSDQDDIWERDKVNIVITNIKNYMLVYSDATVVDKDLKIIRKSYFNGRKNTTGLLRNVINNSYFGATIAFKRELLEYALPFPKKIPMHDQWLGLMAEYYFSTKFINQPLIWHRRHGENASYGGEKSKNSFLKKVSFRINITFSLIKRILYFYSNRRK